MSEKYFHAYSTKIADGLEVSPDLVLNFGNINLIDNPQRESLSIITSLLHQKC